MSVIGLDLGFQSALFAAPRGGGIDVLLNDYSQRSTPTYVNFGEKQRFQGESARQKFVTHFKNTIFAMKRLIGRKYADADVQEELKHVYFRHCALPNGRVGVIVDHGEESLTLSIEQVQANFLLKMQECASKELGEKKVSDCVIGVPCYYTDEQRQATAEAVKIAQMNCLSLMNETTAVALSYGIYKQDLPEESAPPRRVIFVDFGHSQLQMCAAEFVKGKLTMLANAYDANLGGRDFDRLLLNHFANEFKTKYKMDVLGNKRATIRLEVECEKLKKLMSSNTQALPINIECLLDDKDANGSMAREQFEQLAAPLLQRAEAVAVNLRQQLEQLGVNIAEIYAVEVVGGSSRIAAFRAALSNVFGKELSTTLNTDEGVVRGCALRGAMISPTYKVRQFAVVDKTPYAIRISWDKQAHDEESSLELFAPNSAMNMIKMVSLSRQQPFDVKVEYTDASKVFGGHAHIASFSVAGVKPSYDGEPQKVKLKFKLNEHGCFISDGATLSDKLKQDDAAPMEADKAEGEKKEDDKKEEKKDDKKDDEAKKKQKTHASVPLTVVMNKPYARTKEELEAAIESELALLSRDRLEIEKSNAKNALEEYIYEMREKLSSAYEEYVTEADREKLSSDLQGAENWLYEDGDDQPKSVYVSRLKELEDQGNLIKTRYVEAQLRPEAEQQVLQTIVRLRKFLDEHAAGKAEVAHISAEDMAKVREKVEAADAWVQERQNAQRKLSKYDPPAVTAALLNSKKDELERYCNPIVNKPKPKVEPPKETAEKKEAPAAGAEGAGAEGAAGADAGAAPAGDDAAKNPAAEMDID
eukprot:m.135270 g.135270  ORF g.135270 m.135270 type:complete len:814 (-) comp16556_c0_seq2:349-2790(-)